MSVSRRVIVAEGPIGVGKTSFVKRLARHFGVTPLLERAEQNPFLERFYKDPVNGAFPTQLYFLFQRSKQYAELRQSELFQSVQVADFMLQKDHLFARANLADEEYNLYSQVYEKLSLDAPRPDLVVYLQAPVSVLMKRIRRRGIAYEQAIRVEYLEKISAAYVDFFARYAQAPLLMVNTEHLDLAHSEDDFNAVLSMVEKHRGAKQYFNPC